MDGMSNKICVGVGGWTYAPWRGGVFYPKGLPQKRELEYASQHLTSIEINGTFYGSQKPESFAKWHDETPEDFVFALKGPRFATNRRVLAEAGESVQKFLHSGIAELGPKLGPINWQFAHTKQFDPDDFGAFLSLLPQSIDGVVLRHAVEVRHESFCVPEFVALARSHGVAIVTSSHEKYPQIADLTAPFVYARWQTATDSELCGYSAEALELVAKTARAWAKGEVPTGQLQYADLPEKGRCDGRDVFVYLIGGAKQKNPAAALEIIKQL